MPRAKDIAWKFVIRLEGEKWRCPYCEIESSGKVTREKSHFLKTPNRGISGCKKVPERISELMQWLLEQVRSEDDIAWKFVHKLEDNKWRCYYCSQDFFGDLTGVKGHLLRVPNGGIPICPVVPDNVMTLMKSLLGEAAEEQSREARGQSSVAPLSRDMAVEAEVGEEGNIGVAGEESREVNHQFYTMEPQSRDMPTQAAVSEEESREADPQFDKELDSWIVSPTCTQLNNAAATNNPQGQDSHQPYQSFLGQYGHGTGLSPPRAPMDIEPPVPPQPPDEPLSFQSFNSPPQIPGDIINTMGPSTSPGIISLYVK